MKSLNLIFILLLFVVSARAEIYTMPDGHQVEILLVPDKNETVLGEPVYLSLIIRNLSNAEIGFVDGGDYRNEFGRPESFDIEVSDGSGVKLPKIKAGMNMGGLIGFRKIAAGDKAALRFLLPHWTTIEKPDIYTISCRKNMIIRAFDQSSFSERMKSAPVPVNVSARLKVKPASYREIGKLIAALDAKIKAAPDEPDLESVRMLSFIKDARVIKPLADLIEESNGKANTLYQTSLALRTLAKFDGESAFQAIVKYIESLDKNLRGEVSFALSKSVHPKAGEYLLKMQNDSAWEIRLTVVHYLGENKTARSTEILRKMTKDEHNRVRKEAIRYLEERGEKPEQ